MKKCVSAAALRAALSAALVCAAAVSAFAQSIPSPWSARDVGAPTLSGSATYSSGVFTLDAAGVDIWNTSDQFHFVYQAVAGDVEMIARVDSLDDVDPFTNAGVMIRASLNADSAHGYTASTSANGVYFRRRLSAAATTSSIQATGRDAPVWVRIVRQGSLLTSYWSSDGSTWTAIGSSSVSLGTTAYVGLAVSSHNAGTRATGVFSNVKLIKLGSGAPPSGQESTDIGAPAVAGSATYSAGAYTVKGAGAIWDTADRFHFVYQPVTGDAEVVARVGSITKADLWSKAGVMIRESLTPESTHASMFASAGKGYAFQRRLTTGAYTDNTAGGRGTPPGWVKLVRAGDLFTAYRSTDGVTWTKVGADTVPMVATVYVGLAVASHDRDDATTTTAVVDSFKLTAAAAANGSPSVSITSPATGTQVTLPTTVAIAASASDPESRMASVDFYAGSTLIVRDTTAPYSASWTPSGAGTYALTAVAHDADGGSSTSGTVSLTVNTATNKAPTVSLTSPLAGTSFTAPATVTLSATASDPENQLARVEFYAGSTRIATDTTAPYSFSWTNVAAGTYSITARAFDAAGAGATSAAAGITVSAATTSTAPKTVAFTASTDHATNVTNYVLKIFAATADTAKATAVATSDLGKPMPGSTGEITVDRATFFSALAAGTYQATVTAIGPSGQTPSTSITFTR